MIDSSLLIEKFLQNYRFRVISSHINGDVMDFGGNDGELGKMVKGKYLVVNYDHKVMDSTNFDTIVSLAVIEHIEVEEVFKIFSKFKNILKKEGEVVITTPTIIAKPVLEFLAFLGLVDKENIDEHKHYWSKKEIFSLAERSGFCVVKYNKFQFGFNQLAIFKHN